ncbi:MAG: VWA domain-containing protein [Candidatus Acidiferrales bacterium]
MNFLPASRSFLGALVFLVAAYTSFGQSQPHERKKPVIAVHSEVVLVPAIVTDHSGAHVSDLKQGDFTVLENGRQQKIAFFHHIQANAAPDALPAPAAPNEFTNKAETRSERSAILVFDLLNSSITEQSNARDKLMKFLSESPDLGEPVCLLAFDAGGISLLHDFTKDPGLLAEALTNAKDQRSPKDTPNTNPLESTLRGVQGWHSKVSPTRNAVAAQGRTDQLRYAMTNRTAAVGQRVWLTLEALREIGEAYSGIPGRKSLIWATGGFPFVIDDPSLFGTYDRELFPVFENAWRTLNRANIAVYPLDVEDLVSPAYAGPNIGNPLPQHFDTLPNVSNLESFAESTGGKLCDRQTTALGCFNAAVDDSSDYYLIGFYQSSGKSDTGWRKLTVKVSRPDVRVRSRSGYYVRPPQDERVTRKEDIQLALASPLDFTAIHFTVRVTGMTDANGKKNVGFTFLIPPGAIIVDESDNNHVSLDFAALAQQPDGTLMEGGFSQALDGHIKPEGVTALNSRGLSFPASIELPSGEYSVRFVIRDNLAAQVGSITASLKVP